jgi:hypothetical protein
MVCTVRRKRITVDGCERDTILKCLGHVVSVSNGLIFVLVDAVLVNKRLFYEAILLLVG